MKGNKTVSTLLAQNKKALVDLEILEKIEAGVVLTGPEVKSIRGGHANLKGSYIEISQKGEAWAKGIHISPYKHAQQKDHDPAGRRKLLLNRNEIDSLAKELDTKGVTAVPLDFHLKNNRIKMTIGIGRGKKKHDRRDELKKKAQDLEIRRSLKKF